MTYLLKSSLCIIGIVTPMIVCAESKIVIQKDVIKGNSELPKVMYIIPWQSTVTEAKFKGVELENYYESLLKPYHPHRITQK